VHVFSGEETGLSLHLWYCDVVTEAEMLLTCLLPELHHDKLYLQSQWKWSGWSVQ